MARTSSTAINEWAIDVARRMKGVDIPIKEAEARERLKGIRVGDKGIAEYLDNIRFPVMSPNELLRGIAAQVVSPEGVKDIEWPVTLAKATEGLTFPLTHEEAEEKLSGLKIDGRDMVEILGQLKYPVETPADLIHQISMSL